MMLIITAMLVVLGIIFVGLLLVSRATSQSGGNDNVWKRSDEDTRNPDGSSTHGEGGATI